MNTQIHAAANVRGSATACLLSSLGLLFAFPVASKADSPMETVRDTLHLNQDATCFVTNICRGYIPVADDYYKTTALSVRETEVAWRESGIFPLGYDVVNQTPLYVGHESMNRWSIATDRRELQTVGGEQLEDIWAFNQYDVASLFTKDDGLLYYLYPDVNNKYYNNMLCRDKGNAQQVLLAASQTGGVLSSFLFSELASGGIALVDGSSFLGARCAYAYSPQTGLTQLVTDPAATTNIPIWEDLDGYCSFSHGPSIDIVDGCVAWTITDGTTTQLMNFDEEYETAQHVSGIRIKTDDPDHPLTIAEDFIEFDPLLGWTRLYGVRNGKALWAIEAELGPTGEDRLYYGDGTIQNTVCLGANPATAHLGLYPVLCECGGVAWESWNAAESRIELKWYQDGVTTVLDTEVVNDPNPYFVDSFFRARSFGGGVAWFHSTCSEFDPRCLRTGQIRMYAKGKTSVVIPEVVTGFRRDGGQEQLESIMGSSESMILYRKWATQTNGQEPDITYSYSNGEFWVATPVTNIFLKSLSGPIIPNDTESCAAVSDRSLAFANKGSVYYACLDDSLFPDTTDYGAALGAESLDWKSSGNAKWKPVDGGTALQSGDIGNLESSVLTTTVTGPNTLTFDWKVSSNPNGHVLSVLVDGLPYASIQGEVDWTEQSVSIPAGTHTVTWAYTKGPNPAQGDDAAWLRNVSWSSLTIGVAVDAPDLEWWTDPDSNGVVAGPIPWIPQTEVSYDGEDAAKSGVASGQLKSDLSTKVNGPGMLSWRWKGSGSGFYVEASVDGVEAGSLNYDSDWEYGAAMVAGEGDHIVTFSFYNPAGTSCVYLDQFLWVPEGSLQGDSRTVSITVRGSGYVTGCGTYTAGDLCTLEAIPTADAVFSHWEGVLSPEREPTCTFEVVNDIEAVAVFIPMSAAERIAEELGGGGGEGYYTADQIHGLSPASLTIDVDPETNTANLGVVLQRTESLRDPQWSQVILSEEDVSVTGQGELRITVDATSDAAFFRVLETE